MSYTITVNAAPFREALTNVEPHAGRDSAIPALNAVLIESDGLTVKAVATDRYTLATQTVDAITPGDSFKVLIDLGDVKRVAAALKDCPRHVTEWPVKLVMDGDALSVEIIGQTLRLIPVAAEFPKYASIIDGTAQAGTDDAQTVAHIAYNPQLIAKFAKVKVNGKAAGTMRMHFVSPTKPAYVEIGETFRAVLMPQRVDWPVPAVSVTV